ncbi:class I SAM-dependent methyltransferase [Methylobacterium oryzae]|uniref:class I SAM-dependent methyltransferase n=1 Tax=Methylobacterium oryzae TaxID=334852 RepID=UPI001F2260E4|nr:class I SAM-dependent methyltransferase [Methylobacterium oryzae]UIN32937.1 class I SAM-dependent methyltransferase [Methylobacterium oryzae]
MSSSSLNAAGDDPSASQSGSLERLRTERDVDLAKVDLTFEGFRALAQNPHLTANERIGFPETYRNGFEEAILRDIAAKLPALLGTNATIVDIGPGCAGLPHRLIDLCRERNHRLFLVDSAEMLAQLPDVADVTVKIPGAFPAIRDSIRDTVGRADVVLCYSVFHYVYVEGNPFTFLDSIVELLADGGRALIGDIPNISKRRRFFASETGRRFHKAFTRTETEPDVQYNEPNPGKIDDAVLMGLIQRAQAAGADAYLMPQAPDLPMANRREDLLIMKA